ncbi:hypothetical protein IB286_01775 [Spongiibacter sp. KMU-158]|uniref:Uncharacterized protein n=1 Tax=Spongiibacter pelagi TaxID=2760804 RepID=A0A927GVB9_9GAMM|nr:hypothetical protein [Spongiibacter pelagi]MBD2857717.1 hypothetical protein [Spongiibacter pelagi]
MIKMSQMYYRLYQAFRAILTLMICLFLLRSAGVANWSQWSNQLLEIGVMLLFFGASIVFGFLSGKAFSYHVACVPEGEPESFQRSFAAATGAFVVIVAIGVVVYALFNH